MTDIKNMRVGIEDAVRETAKMLSILAAPGKIPGNTYRGVEITFDLNAPGIAFYRLVTRDDIEVTVRVDFSLITRDYLQNMMAGAKKYIEEHRAARSPLILPHNVMRFVGHA